MAKMTQAQLVAFLAASGITLEDSANATVAPTSVTRKVKAPKGDAPAAPYTLEQTKFKNHPCIAFNNGKPFGAPGGSFSIGYGKLRTILAHADSLRKIVS